ncbi:MAG: Gfo/Idh/MocA family oxidoreductase [Planctomycetaceae bacterium]
MTSLNRRDFINSTAALAAATFVSGASEARANARQRVRVAVMGVRSRGRQLIENYSHFDWVDFAYLCDADTQYMPEAAKAITAKGRKEPKMVQDFRAALDDPEVDVLICAAPNHWHGLATILACQAGKDVYVEKPVSHNIGEGRRMVEAARKYKRIVQSGTQRRSGADFQEAIDLLKQGRIGEVRLAKTWINGGRPNIGYEEVVDPPESLDFNLWCGPAPNNGYKKNLVPYNWHWRWDYGGGECANNGIHGLDLARWGMGMEYPETIVSGGNKYVFDDDQQTPDTQMATFDFPGGAIHWEHYTWSKMTQEGEGFGVMFYGTEGTLFCRSGGWSIYNKDNKEVEKRESAERDRAHILNFLECLETRSLPNADIEIGHRSAALCHLANIAIRTRSTITYDGEKETILDNEPAQALLNREPRSGFEYPTLA